MPFLKYFKAFFIHFNSALHVLIFSVYEEDQVQCNILTEMKLPLMEHINIEATLTSISNTRKVPTGL